MNLYSKFLLKASKEYRLRAFIAATELKNNLLPEHLCPLLAENYLHYEEASATGLVLGEIERLCNDYLVQQTQGADNLKYPHGRIARLLLGEECLPEQLNQIDILNPPPHFLESLGKTPSIFHNYQKQVKLIGHRPSAGINEMGPWGSEEEKIKEADAIFAEDSMIAEKLQKLPDMLNQILHLATTGESVEEIKALLHV